MIEKLLLIGGCGAVGSILRFLMALWIQRPQGPRLEGAIVFPLGTLAVNVAGSLLMGFLAAMMLSGAWPVRESVRLAILVGLLGGFTTYSAFSFETIELLQAGQNGLAAVNVVITNAGCIGAAGVGILLAHRLIAAGV